MLVAQAKTNFKSALGKYNSKEPLTDDQAVLGLEGVLPDLAMDATSYRAVAMLLLSHRHKKPALVTCKKAVELSEKPLDKVKSLELMARILLKQGKAEKAHKDIVSCAEDLDHETVTPSIRRSVFATKARAEVEMEDYAAAAESYRQSRTSDPTNLTSALFLDEEISLFSEDEGKKKYMDTLKQWSPLERLTWLAWDYEDMSDDRHAGLRDAAFQSGEAAFVGQIYEDAIRYLDNVGAAAPLRCDLAYFHLEVSQDLEKARIVIDEALDSGSTGWPYAVTEEYPGTTLERAIQLQSDILNRLFMKSNDPVAKAELLEAVKGLLMRPLALDVPPESDTNLVQRRVIMARMYLKMGPATEFQSTLQGLINTCIDALTDSVGWNDTYQLRYLATAVSILGEALPNGEKLLRMARILMSAQFNRLDPNIKNDSESDSESGSDSSGSYSGSESDWAGSGSEDGSSSDEDEEPPTDEGDLDDPYNVGLSCDGVCVPVNDFAWWKGRVAYQCVTCNDFLCETCYENRQADNRGERPIKGRQYCGRGHTYIKGPIEGWRGVKDGKVMLEGEEPVEFKELLRHLRDELCKEAWESFWSG